MEAAWLALAEDQDWLDGERAPVEPARSVSESNPADDSLHAIQLVVLRTCT